jgi:hypothetical protein
MSSYLRPEAVVVVFSVTVAPCVVESMPNASSPAIIVLSSIDHPFER